MEITPELVKLYRNWSARNRYYIKRCIMGYGPISKKLSVWVQVNDGTNHILTENSLGRVNPEVACHVLQLYISMTDGDVVIFDEKSLAHYDSLGPNMFFETE